MRNVHLRVVFVALLALATQACERDRTKAPPEPTEDRGPMPVPGVYTERGNSQTVEDARFGIFVETGRHDRVGGRWLYGRDYLEVSYWLAIDVDEESGDDGAAQPQADEIPVFAAAGNKHPNLLTELPGLTVDDATGWKVWYGNDAGLVDHNRMTFHGWRDGRLELSWTGSYEGRPIRFEGAATFDGISLNVRRPEDADRFMVAAFGQAYVDRLEQQPVDWSPSPDEAEPISRSVEYELRR